MRRDLNLVGVEATVAVPHSRSGPQPARLGLVDLGPEPILWPLEILGAYERADGELEGRSALCILLVRGEAAKELDSPVRCHASAWTRSYIRAISGCHSARCRRHAGVSLAATVASRPR